MKKKILKLFTAFVMLVSFITPTYAKENKLEYSNNYIDTKAIPTTTHNFSKSKTVGGVTVTVRIKCTERLLGGTSIMEYTSGDCSIVSVTGGTATLVSDFQSGTAGVGVNDDLIVIVYFNYANSNGTKGSNSISFTIRGNKSI